MGLCRRYSGTRAYDFQLITVLVIDDYDEGIPVAWPISNRETADVLRDFCVAYTNCEATLCHDRIYPREHS